MAVIARVLGMMLPIWLIVLFGSIMIVGTRAQEAFLQRGRFARWMPAAHLNLGLMLLTIWVLFSGSLHSPFVWVYAIAVAIYGVLWGMRWALGTATLCSAYLLLASWLEGWMRLFPMGVADPQVPLRAALVGHIAMFFLVAVVSGNLRRHVRDISQLARTDPLTGLGNRQELRQALDQAMARAALSGSPASLLLVELDRFKAINDRFGHLQGDEVLRRVAVILRASCRTTDVLARFGGDEFVVVLPGTDSDEANHVAERIRTDVEEQLVLIGTRVTASVGVATFPHDATTIHDLLEAADRAVYYAKATGGNRVVQASDGLEGFDQRHSSEQRDRA